MEKLSQKRLLASGSRLFYIVVVFYNDLWRAEGRVSEADGCVFLAADLAAVYQCGILFPDLTVVSGACHTLSADADDARTDCGVGGVDICEPQALPSLFTSQEAVIYQLWTAYG